MNARTGLHRAAAAAAAAAMMAAPLAAAALQTPEGPTAYRYIIYADAAKTEIIGTAEDTCGQSGSYVYVISPNLPTPYYDQERAFICSEMGPYIPSDW